MTKYQENSKFVRINKKTKQKLDKLKIHPRESYSDVIQRCIDKLKL
jgi:predicted CopG family antitoxin